MARRYFEFVEGTSSKFWEVWIERNELRTRYGKIGTAGQTTVKDEGSAEAAQKLHDKLVREKTGKGYVEKASGSVGPPNERVTAPMEAKAMPKKAPEPEAEEEEEADAPVVVEEGYRRWENTEDGSSKFWEIKLDESSHTVRFGKIGTAGQEKTKDFESEGEAEDDADKLIAEKTKKGYRPVGKHGPDLGPSNPELEAAIGKDLDDARSYLVYADWLSGQSDPRGELIVLQHQEATSTDEAKVKELKKAGNTLIKKHREKLLGALAEFKDGDGKDLELEWHLGFIRGAHMSWPMYDDDGSLERKAAKELGALLELPTAKFLRTLKLGPFPGEEESNFQPLINALAAKPPRHLEELFLGELGDWDISMTALGDFSDAVPALQSLKKLTLRSGRIDFPKGFAFPELTDLTIETGSLTTSDIKEICLMKCPKLERLSLWFGSKNYGASGGLKDIAPILMATGFPKLEHLGIMNCEFVNEVAAALPTSKVLKQLTSLDLSMGCLNDASIDKMVASNAFGHLEALNLDDNGLTDASKPKVKALGKNVSFGKEQDPDRAADGHYRYCTVGE